MRKTKIEQREVRTVYCDLCKKKPKYGCHSCYRCNRDICTACIADKLAVDLRPDRNVYGTFVGPYFCAECERLSRAENDPIFAAVDAAVVVEDRYRQAHEAYCRDRHPLLDKVSELVEARLKANAAGETR